MNQIKYNEPFIAKTFSGLEDIVANELKFLNATNIRKGSRVVYFNGNKEILYKANLYLRSAIRLLVPLTTFKTRHDNAIYENVKKIDWSSIFSLTDTFAVDSTVNSNYFNHSKYIALRVKDAIADFFRDKYRQRPSVDTEFPTIRIHIHISHDTCDLLLDSSGDVLYKRGYRKNTGIAPINEVLAAGLITMSEWDKKNALLDPMCGSGTIPIEAAMIASNIPAGFFRKSFGFMKWYDFDKGLWRRIYNEAKQNIKIPEAPIIYASDISQKMIAITNDNIENAQLHNVINVTKMTFEELKPPVENGTLIMNPPYGERIEQQDIIQFYKMIGNTLKRNFAGYTAWILTSNTEAAKYIGLKPSKKIVVYNGQLECKFLKFDLYSGSKKLESNLFSI